MTGTIDAHPMTGGAEPQRGAKGLTGFTPTSLPPTALVEQAKGVLIFRYSIAADAAYSLLELWAAQMDATVDEVAHAIVHEICQGDRTVPSHPGLVRWLEERLRHELPGVECEGSS